MKARQPKRSLNSQVDLLTLALIVFNIVMMHHAYDLIIQALGAR